MADPNSVMLPSLGSSATTSDAKADTAYAVLPSGKLGEHPDDATGIKRVWPHKLPFLAQKVVDKGFDLPNPYGFGGVYAYVEQGENIDDLRISLNQSGGNTPVPFVTVQESRTHNNAFNLKLDTWLFPFLNVFLLGGYLEGSTTVPVNIPGEATLKALLPSVGALCDGPPLLRPPLCSKDIVLIDKTSYTGTTYGVGVVLPIGWRNYFVAIPITYTYTNLSTVDSQITAFQASLRGGYHWPVLPGQMLAVFGGATYLDSEQDVSGTFHHDDPSLPGGGIDIGYTVHQSAADKLNYLVGFNWTISRRWFINAEVGFGGQRNDFISGVTYRW